MKKTLRVALVCGILALVHGASADAAAAEAKSKYPLQTCVVSGEKLGDHGKPYVFTHEKTEVQLCCKGCLKDFKKEPAKYIKKIEDAGKK
jgi:hypothetical protein